LGLRPLPATASFVGGVTSFAILELDHRKRCENDAKDPQMIDLKQNIHSMTTFKRNSSGLMKG
jgi:hypothetical protein